MKKDPRYNKILIIDILFIVALVIGFIYLLDKYNYSLILFTIFTVVIMGLIPIVVRKASSDVINRVVKKNDENKSKNNKK